MRPKEKKNVTHEKATCTESMTHHWDDSLKNCKEDNNPLNIRILPQKVHVSVVTHSVGHVSEVECHVGLGIPYVPVCVIKEPKKLVL